MEQNKLLRLKEETLIMMESLGYSPHTIKRFTSTISIYIDYLLSNDYEPNAVTVLDFISIRCAEKRKEKDSSYYISYRGTLNKFIGFIENGYITIGKLPYRNHKICGGISAHINNFVSDILVDQLKLKPVTILDYKRDLKLFNEFIISSGSNLENQTVLQYFTEIGYKYVGKPYKLYDTKVHLRLFFDYLYKKQITSNNLSEVIPDIKYIRNKHLPSVFTSQEVKKIIECVDRNSAYGKRAYAMILLATRYGLRSGDIVGLKFENIDWENNKISLYQEKTKRMIELPLLPEVGNAILDYLKNTRRESSLPFVFLNIKGPVTPITKSAFYNILNKYCKLANLDNMEKRHHGPHSLRHSLANKMLENGEALTTISAVLGHSTTQVTTVYLSINQENLKKCSLPIPQVHSHLYVKEDE